MGLAMKSGMLSIAATSSKHNSGRRRRSAEATSAEAPAPGEDSTRHLKSVDSEEAEPEAGEGEMELGADGNAPMADVAGLPLDGGPDNEASASASAESATSSEPMPSDYSTIGAYLHELRRYPLMTREEEH